MKSLRFCFPTTFYPPHSFGGDAVAVQRLARALVRRGHEVTVIHDVDAFELASGGVKLPIRESDEGVEVIPLRSRARGLSPLLAHQSGMPLVHRATLEALFRSRSFDVVNFHNTSLMGGPGLFGLAGDSIRAYTAHEHWLICPTHVLWRNKREICPKRQCVRCQLINRRPPQLWRYLPGMARHYEEIDIFIAMSDFSAARHAEFGFPHEMAVLPPFADEPVADAVVNSADTSSPHPVPYFFFAGRLEQIKGLQTVIPLLSAIPGVDLVVAGQGSWREKLEEQASGNVKFLGALTREDLSRYYRNAIATLAPSITYETFGLTIIESFAHGTPVIARRLGPFPDIIERSGGGILFGSDDELVEAMRTLAANAGVRRELGALARDGYEKWWSEEAVVPAYVSLVESASRRRR